MKTRMHICYKCVGGLGSVRADDQLDLPVVPLTSGMGAVSVYSLTLGGVPCLGLPGFVSAGEDMPTIDTIYDVLKYV